MAKQKEEKENIEKGKDKDKDKLSIKKKKKVKKHRPKFASNEDIIKYCIDNNLLYALMLWLEIDLEVKVIRSGVIKSFKTSLGTNSYYFVTLDPNKQQVIKEIEMSDEEYKDYERTLYNELSAYLTESELKPASAKRMFGSYVYNKLNKVKSDDIDLESFVYHIKRFRDIMNAK